MNSADIGFPMLVLEGEEVNTLCGWRGGRPLLLQTRSFVKLSYFCLSCVVSGMMRTHKKGKIVEISLHKANAFAMPRAIFIPALPQSVSTL